MNDWQTNRRIQQWNYPSECWSLSIEDEISTDNKQAILTHCPLVMHLYVGELGQLKQINQDIVGFYVPVKCAWKSEKSAA